MRDDWYRLPSRGLVNYTASQFDIHLPKRPASRAADIFVVRSDCALVPISPHSRLADRSAVERFARYFMRESGTDFMQFDAREYTDPYQAFLWCTRELSVGACCFRRRGAGMAMQWVWLHPFARSRRLLLSAWPVFVERFGEHFPVEGPYSAAMQRFLD